MNLSRLNLNLLPPLKALLDSQSVSGAAQMMHVTQSAMSRTLSQLREAMNDPILIRKGNRTFLSAKACSLQSEVDRILAEAESLFENQQFDISTNQRHFRIFAEEALLSSVMPDILADIWSHAHGLTFDLHGIHSGVNIIDGRLDLCVGYSASPAIGGIQQTPILEDRISLLMDRSHPLTRQPITASNLQYHPIIVQENLVGLQSPNRAHSVTESLRTVMHSSSLSLSLSLIRKKMAVLLAPESILTLIENDGSLIARELPGCKLTCGLKILWPDYWEINRAHRWLREYIQTACLERIDQSR